MLYFRSRNEEEEGTIIWDQRVEGKFLFSVSKRNRDLGRAA